VAHEKFEVTQSALQNVGSGPVYLTDPRGYTIFDSLRAANAAKFAMQPVAQDLMAVIRLLPSLISLPPSYFSAFPWLHD
jgi:hypothetical protein